jgi:hypothetical protein
MCWTGDDDRAALYRHNQAVHGLRQKLCLHRSCLIMTSVYRLSNFMSGCVGQAVVSEGLFTDASKRYLVHVTSCVVYSLVCHDLIQFAKLFVLILSLSRRLY